MKLVATAVAARVRLAHWRTGLVMDRDSLLGKQARLVVVEVVASLEATTPGWIGSLGSTMWASCNSRTRVRGVADVSIVSSTSSLKRGCIGGADCDTKVEGALP